MAAASSLEPSAAQLVKELHDDLVRKYKSQGASVERMWTSFDSKQREKCLRAGAAEGVVLKHPLDRGMGNVCKVVPELNLRDVAESGPDFLLALLKHRATASLFEQYCSGVGDGQGDSAFIQEMMRTRGLRHVEPFKNCWSFFLDDDQYGSSFRIVSEVEETLASFKVAIDAGLCIPQSVGELILQRQISLLQTLNILIDDILEEGSKSRSQPKKPTKRDKPKPTATTHEPPKDITIADLLSMAGDRRAAHEEYLASLADDSALLARAVNIMFFTRPELLADEKGRILPAHTDKHISPAFFEVIDCTIQGAATWRYIERLLGLLENAELHKTSRTVVLQELSNVCYAEYTRTQGFFRRNIQTASGSGWFRRIAGAVDKDGKARVSMKGDPAKLTRSDPQLHYLLRLCQPAVTASQAFDWTSKLGDLHNSHPGERDKLEEREVDALYDLVILVGFIHDLSQMVRLPPHSDKRGRIFASNLAGINAQLGKLKAEIDLREFAVPIDNLKEPGMAEAALKTLDNFILEKTGTKLGFLYQDLVDDSVAKLEDQCREVASKTGGNPESTADSALPLLFNQESQPVEKLEQRRQKQKTRPATTSIYELVPSHEASVAAELASLTVAPPTPAPTFKVSPATASVFSTLFIKSQSRGSISWAAFEAAMVALGFSVLPRFGSVYTFSPPDSMSVNRAFTIHRPHKSEIEGVLIPIIARRLRRAYGWDETSFEVA